MVTWIVASCGTTSQMGGSGCFGYWNTDGPLKGTRDANRNRSYPYRQCVEKTVSHSWWKIERRAPRVMVLLLLILPKYFWPQRQIGFFQTVESLVLRSKVITVAIRWQFQTGMRSTTTLSAEFLYQSHFTRSVEPGWIFAGTLTVWLPRLAFPVYCITATFCSMIGRANLFGLE